MKKRLFFVGAMLVVSSNIFAQHETEIEEVTIASKTKQQRYKIGKNVQLISEKDLEKHKGQTLPELLNQLAGFQITGNFNNAAEPKAMKIRGGKSANILILVDGVPLRDVTGNDYTVSDLRLIALENVASIELLNGGSSVLYGSNATVSVINIITKKSDFKNIEGFFGAEAGSFSTFRQKALVSGNLNKFNYQISGANEKSNGISSAQGENFEADGFEKQNVNAGFGYGTEKLNLNINGGWSHHLFDYDDGAFADGNNRGNDFLKFVGGGATYKYLKGELSFKTRYSANEREGETLNNDRYQSQFSYSGRALFSEILNSYVFSENFNLSTGFQYENQKLGAKSLPWGATNLQEDLKMSDTSAYNFDVFTNANFKYKLLNVAAGVRYTDHSKFGQNWVYSINPFILKELKDLYLKVGYSYSTSFIAPTLYQNYGSLPYVLANFDLKPETNSSQEIDISLGKKDQSIVFNASLYQRKEENAFAYEITDFDTYAGRFTNVDGNKVKGFEVGFAYRINDVFNLGSNFSFVEKEKEATMLRQPKQRVNSFLEITPFRFTRLNLTHQFISKRADSYYDTATFGVVNKQLEAFNLFNLNVSQKLNSKINSYLNIGNLFNISYVDVIGYTTKPRNYTLGVEYQF